MTISLRAKVHTASSTNVLGAADREYAIGDEVLLFRERPIGKCVDPYVIRQKENKMLTLDTGDRLLSASIDKVEPYQDRGEEYAYDKAESIMAQMESLPLFTPDHGNDDLGETEKSPLSLQFMTHLRMRIHPSKKIIWMTILRNTPKWSISLKESVTLNGCIRTQKLNYIANP